MSTPSERSVAELEMHLAALRQGLVSTKAVSEITAYVQLLLHQFLPDGPNESKADAILKRLTRALSDVAVRESQKEFDFESVDGFLASARRSAKRADAVPDTEILYQLASTDEAARERGFAELRRQVADDDLRDSAINLLLTAFQSYILERSVAAVNQITRATFSAQDVAQLVNLKLAKRVRDGRVELRNVPQFKVLLRTMTQRLATDKVRVKPQPKARVHATKDDEEPLPIAASDPRASSIIAAAELEAIVRRRLQPDEWAAFQARFYDNLDWDGVAASLYPNDTITERNRRADAIRIRLGRALKKLATHLAEIEPLLAEKGLLPKE